MNPFGKATERLVNDIDSSGTLIVRVLTKATSLTGFYAVLISSAWFPDHLLFFDSQILVLSPHDFFAASQSAEHFFFFFFNDSVVPPQDDASFVSFSSLLFAVFLVPTCAISNLLHSRSGWCPRSSLGR